MLYFSFVASSIQPTLRTQSLFLQVLSSLTGHDTLYSISTSVHMVPTVGQKPTNMQFTELHNPVVQQDSSGLLVWRQHAMPLQAVTSLFG